jgi:hypothetical protein
MGKSSHEAESVWFTTVPSGLRPSIQSEALWLERQVTAPSLNRQPVLGCFTTTCMSLATAHQADTTVRTSSPNAPQMLPKCSPNAFPPFRGCYLVRDSNTQTVRSITLEGTLLGGVVDGRITQRSTMYSTPYIVSKRSATSKLYDFRRLDHPLLHLQYNASPSPKPPKYYPEN